MWHQRCGRASRALGRGMRTCVDRRMDAPRRRVERRSTHCGTLLNAPALAFSMLFEDLAELIGVLDVAVSDRRICTDGLDRDAKRFLESLTLPSEQPAVLLLAPYHQDPIEGTGRSSSNEVER